MGFKNSIFQSRGGEIFTSIRLSSSPFSLQNLHNCIQIREILHQTGEDTYRREEFFAMFPHYTSNK